MCSAGGGPGPGGDGSGINSGFETSGFGDLNSGNGITNGAGIAAGFAGDPGGLSPNGGVNGADPSIGITAGATPGGGGYGFEGDTGGGVPTSIGFDALGMDAPAIAANQGNNSFDTAYNDLQDIYARDIEQDIQQRTIVPPDSLLGRTIQKGIDTFVSVVPFGSGINAAIHGNDMLGLPPAPGTPATAAANLAGETGFDYEGGYGNPASPGLDPYPNARVPTYTPTAPVASIQPTPVAPVLAPLPPAAVSNEPTEALFTDDNEIDWTKQNYSPSEIDRLNAAREQLSVNNALYKLAQRNVGFAPVYKQSRTAQEKFIGMPPSRRNYSHAPRYA